MSSQITPRADRVPYNGTAFLLVPFGPWALNFQLSVTNISKTGLHSHLSLSNLTQIIDKNDLDSIFKNDITYRLQIEANAEHLESPTLTAKLARKNLLGQSLEIGFSFDQSFDEFLNLVSPV